MVEHVIGNDGVASPILGTKKEILKLILSDCKIEGKNLCFSINKPFDELIKTAETDKWCH